ncbi:MAG: phosphatidylserine decarboxylase, partial [Sulfurifustaceae bacterium]
MASLNRHPLFAREGWTHIGVAGGLAVVVHAFAGGLVAAPFWAAFAFVLNFFRDPARTIPNDAKAVVCPADGRIVALGEIDDPYLQRRSLRISIFMNVFNVHSNRMPVAGQVRQVWYHQGKFLNAALDKASESNERNAVSIRTDRGPDVVVVQVAGLIARRILSYVQPNERVEQGQRYG